MDNYIPQYAPEFGEAETKAVHQYMQSGGWITEHTKTREFEDAVADYLGVNHCLATSNGTISLSLALLAKGVRHGDGVIVPALTMVATANAVGLLGAHSVFVDIDPNNMCLDVDKVIAESEHKGIAGVIWVSLNGRTNKSGLKALKHRFARTGQWIIEDAAQSFGATRCTTDITSFSFSTPKIISMGQGGCLVTNRDDLARQLHQLKDFGRESSGSDVYNGYGINAKITDIQAVIGIEQLKRIEYRIKRKRFISKQYREQLQGVEDIRFVDNAKGCVPWFIDIYTNDRNKLRNQLHANGIGSRPIYTPLPHLPVYETGEAYPVAERFSRQGLWLPSSFGLTTKDVTRVCDTIKGIMNERA